MTEIPNTGPDAGSDTVAENPALTGGVFRSGPDNPHKRIVDMINSGDNVMSVAGQDFNDMLLASAGPERCADLIDTGDNLDDGPRADRLKAIADMIESGDDLFDGRPGAEGAGEAEGAENASPRALGFDIAEMNCDHALVDWGGKAAVVKERPHGPINGRIQLMTFEFAEHHPCEPSD